MKHGYAGDSTDDQSPVLQLAALQRAGCKTIFKDDGLSRATTTRPAPLRCMKKLEHGDTLAWKLDPLGRSLRDPINMLDELKRRGVKFRSLTEAIDTETPTGRAMWQMIGVLAKLDPRRSEGRAAPGSEIRPQAEISRQQIDHARKLIDDGQRREDVAALLNVDRATLCQALGAERAT